MSFPAQSLQRAVVQIAKRYDAQAKLVSHAQSQMVQQKRTWHDLLDGLIGQYLTHGRVDFGSILGQVVSAKRANRVDGQPQIAGGIDDTQSHRVHHAGLQQDGHFASAVRRGGEWGR